MTTADKARNFAALHRKGDPLVLYNIWDAGSAKTVAAEGARALATGSWSVAAAQGYPDGEAIPLELLETIAGQIVRAVDVPVSVDFEGAYAVAPEEVATHVRRVVALGAVGINFEDQIVAGEGLHPIAKQIERIAAARQAAGTQPFYLNARTDLFLKEQDSTRHPSLLPLAKERATAYAEAGASGFFVPGLTEPELIGEMCSATELPVNVMMAPGQAPLPRLAELGVARISHGPGPYRKIQQELKTHYRKAMTGK